MVTEVKEKMGSVGKWSKYAIWGFVLSFIQVLSIIGIGLSIYAIYFDCKKGKRGKGLAIAGIIIGTIVFISSMSLFNSNSENSYKTGLTPQVTNLDISLQNLKNQYAGLTDLQKKNYFNDNLLGTYVTWDIYVKNIDRGWLTEYELLGLANPPSEYSIGSDVGVHFKSSEQSKLGNLNKGDLVGVTGKLKDYGSTISDIFYLDDAILVSKLATTPTGNSGSGSFPSSTCSNWQNQCYNQGISDACTSLSQAVAIGGC